MSERGVALVTGGARRVGRAISLKLAEAGHAVAIHCNASVREAESLAEEIVRAGGEAAIVSADLADPAAVEGVIAAAQMQLGPVTFLVNNASLFLRDQVTAIDVPTWNRQFSVNIRAPSVLAGMMANALPRDMTGAIVNILDQRVWKLTPEFYSYTLSKAAMWAATRTMAQALAPRIRVNAIAPSLTRTPLAAPLLGSEAVAAALAAQHPLGRLGEPDDLAAAARFLLSPEASWITGQVLGVDGGRGSLRGKS